MDHFKFICAIILELTSLVPLEQPVSELELMRVGGILGGISRVAALPEGGAIIVSTKQNKEVVTRIYRSVYLPFFFKFTLLKGNLIYLYFV